MHGSVNLKSLSMLKHLNINKYSARVFWVTYYLKILWHKCVEIRAAEKSL